MEIYETLEALKKKALADKDLREKLLATRKEKNPLSAFCKLCTDAGLPLYEMDLIEYGEADYAAMRRSTNGGGENSPLLNCEDDAYEMFLTILERQGQ